MDRRVFLMDASAIILSPSNLFRSENTLDFRDSKSALLDLASRLEEKDLADPANNQYILEGLERKVKIAEKGVNSEITELYKETFQRADGLRKKAPVLDSNSGRSQQMQNEIKTIKAVLPYYTSLLEYFRVSAKIHEEISSVERDVLSTKSSKLVVQARELRDKLKNVKNALTEFQRTNQVLSEKDGLNFEKITPSRGQVLSELETLNHIYKGYTESLYSYGKSSQLIEKGSKERERSFGGGGELSTAERVFRKAATSSDLAIDENALEYTIEDTTFTLKKYHKLLSMYQQAAEKMAQSCKGQDSKSIEALQQGINIIIEARSLAEAS